MLAFHLGVPFLELGSVKGELVFGWNFCSFGFTSTKGKCNMCILCMLDSFFILNVLFMLETQISAQLLVVIFNFWQLSGFNVLVEIICC